MIMMIIIIIIIIRPTVGPGPERRHGRGHVDVRLGHEGEAGRDRRGAAGLQDQDQVRVGEVVPDRRGQPYHYVYYQTTDNDNNNNNSKNCS